MRPLSFRSDELRSHLLRSKIATLGELKQALGTSVDVTVFRKLKSLDYLTSYSHRGRYYTLREIARFDEQGLWSQSAVWFSQFGTLLSTAETFVNRFPRGYFADELARALHVDVQDSLHQLVQQRRVTRQIVSGLYLYTAIDRTIQQGQLLTRRNVEAVPTVVDASVLEVSEEELKAAGSQTPRYGGRFDAVNHRGLVTRPVETDADSEHSFCLKQPPGVEFHFEGGVDPEDTAQPRLDRRNHVAGKRRG